MSVVSIIIPVYNGEKHIEKCIEKVLKQTYRKIEIIVINDGSKDNTKEILERLKKKDRRLKVVNKENTGVSDSRNIGIDIATGDYILFLDSDDSLLDDATEKLLKKVDGRNVDVLLFGYQVIGSKNRKNDTEILKTIIESQDKKSEILKRIIDTKNNIYGYIWRAMYSRKFLLTNNLKFPQGIKISEDYMFLVDVINKSNIIDLDSKEYYIYNLNDSSMSTKYIPSLSYDMFFVNEWIFKNIINENLDLNEGYVCCICNSYLRFVQNEVRNRNISTWEKVEKIYKFKKKKNLEHYLNQVWYKKRKFDLKSFIGMILFKFNLEFIYVILFKLKLKIKER